MGWPTTALYPTSESFAPTETVDPTSEITWGQPPGALSERGGIWRRAARGWCRRDRGDRAGAWQTPTCRHRRPHWRPQCSACARAQLVRPRRPWLTPSAGWFYEAGANESMTGRQLEPPARKSLMCSGERRSCRCAWKFFGDYAPKKLESFRPWPPAAPLGTSDRDVSVSPTRVMAPWVADAPRASDARWARKGLPFKPRSPRQFASKAAPPRGCGG